MKNATPETETALAVREDAPLPVARATPSAVDILQSAMQHGITEANVAVVERMAALVERQQDRQAERDYAVALANLQKECSNVIATKDVDGKFRYAPFLDIWNSVRPSVEKYGFTLQWDQEHLGDRVKKKLTLQHIGGHKTTREWTIRLGSNAPGTPTGSQAPVLDEIADSRAKRRLLMDALNIVVDAITPAEDLGDGTLASPEETDGLFRRLEALGGGPGSQTRFLALAGVKAWSQIPKTVLPILERLLAEKERAAKAKQSGHGKAAEGAPVSLPAAPQAPQTAAAAAQPSLPLSSPSPAPKTAPSPAQAPKPAAPVTPDRTTLVLRVWDLAGRQMGRDPNERSWKGTRDWLTAKNLLERDRKISELEPKELQAIVTVLEIDENPTPTA